MYRERETHTTSPELRVVGPPGTGKTRFLARELNYSAGRYGPECVVAMSHTRAAAAELIGRKTQVPNSNVGTVHAMAYRAIGKPDIAEVSKNLAQFSSESGYAMSATRDIDDLAQGLASENKGDDLLAEVSRFRNMQVPEEVWPMTVRTFHERWQAFKQETDTVDFTDMLEIALHDCEYAPGAPAVMVVDEVQDSTPLQLALAWQWGAKVERLIFAGDANQSIYGFAGADPSILLRRKPRKRKVLRESYRVPHAVAELAVRWLSRTREREDEEWKPRDAEGQVTHHGAIWSQPESLLRELLRALDGQSDRGLDNTVMVAASCAYMVAPLVKLLRKEGIPFSNPWRRKRGDWNPLARRKGTESAATAIAAFLEPWTEPDGVRSWTVEQVRAWVPLTKKLFKHGEASCIVNLPEEATPREVCQTFLDHLVSRDDWERATVGPPDNVRWLLSRLRAGKQKAARYAADVALKSGSAALEEEPRLHVGTIHSFKGAEADHVLLFPDLSPQGAEEWWGQGRDSVIRQFYVGMTRARETLTLCAPASGAAVMLSGRS